MKLSESQPITCRRLMMPLLVRLCRHSVIKSDDSGFYSVAPSKSWYHSWEWNVYCRYPVRSLTNPFAIEPRRRRRDPRKHFWKNSSMFERLDLVVIGVVPVSLRVFWKGRPGNDRRRWNVVQIQSHRLYGMRAEQRLGHDAISSCHPLGIKSTALMNLSSLGLTTHQTSWEGRDAVFADSIACGVLENFKEVRSLLFFLPPHIKNPSTLWEYGFRGQSFEFSWLCYWTQIERILGGTTAWPNKHLAKQNESHPALPAGKLLWMLLDPIRLFEVSLCCLLC